jgi:CHASE2 domain-containing sensor protein
LLILIVSAGCLGVLFLLLGMRIRPSDDKRKRRVFLTIAMILFLLVIVSSVAFIVDVFEPR